jgi:SNF2 family DNA or RNA helicase
VVGIKNLPLLRDRIGPFILRRTKKEVLPQLPPKLPPQAFFVQLSPEEEKAYEAFTGELGNWLTTHGVSGAGNAMVQTLRMRQFCCSPMLFTDELGKGSKFAALETIIDQHEGQIVVFCFFKEMVKLLLQWLGADPRATITGDVSAEQRKIREVEFNAGKLGKVMVCNDAAQKGLNFVGADMIIHYDQIFNAQKMAQREDRLHRIGQQLPVNVIHML